MNEYEALLEEVRGGQQVPREPIAPTESEEAQLLRQVRDQSKAIGQSNVYEASFGNPDEEAKKRRAAQQLQTELGDTTPAYLIDLGDAERRIKQSAANRAVGKTAEFLTNPDNAKIGIDDTENLQNIEKYIREGLVSGRAAKGVIGGARYVAPEIKDIKERDIPWSGLAKRGLQSGFWGTNVGIAGTAAAPFETATQGLESVGLPKWAAETELGKLFRAMAESASAQQASIDAPLPEGNLESGVTSGVQSLTQNVLTLPAGVATKSYKAFAGLMAGITGGQSYIEATAKGLEPAKAAVYGAADAVAEYVTELYAGKALFDIPGVKTGVKSVLKGAANFATKEIIGEEIATVWQDFNKWMALNPEKTLDDFIAERPDAAIQTAIATVVGGGGQIVLMTGVNSLIEKGQKAQGADKLSEDLTALNKLVRASKVLERDSDVGQSFFQSVLEEYGEAADVWINPKTLEESGLSEEISSIPEVKEQLGVVGNSDIRIPVASMLAKMSEQDVQVLAPLVSEEPGGMNSVEAKEYYQSGAAQELQAVVETYLKGKNDESVFRSSQENVKTAILEEMNAVGRFTPQKNEADATLLASYYAVRAAQTGVTPEQLYSRRKVNFGAENVAGQQYQQSVNDFLTAFDLAPNLDVRTRSYSDKELDSDQAKFLSSFPEGTRYSDSTRLLARIRKSSDKISNALRGNPETARVNDGSLGPFSQYEVRGEVLPGDSFSPSGKLLVKVFGKEQVEKGLAEEPALTFTVSADGELSVNGPDSNSDTFAEFKKLGWADNAVGRNGEVQTGWTALKVDGNQLPFSQVINLIADVHARVRAWKNAEKVGLHWSRSTGSLGGLFSQPESAVYFQKVSRGDTPPDLIIQHNLTAENLLHAVKMGGIPVPSLAVTKKDHPLISFGEITLLGSKEMADPKGYAGTKVFGADIYSPRYPSVEYQFTANMQKRAEAMLKDGIEATGSRIDWDEWQNRGPEGAKRTVPLMWKFLKEQGIEPKIVRKEAKQLPDALQQFANNTRFSFDLEKDPAFIEAAWRAHEDALTPAYDGDREAARAEIAQMRKRAEERGVSYLVRGYADDVAAYQRAQRENGNVDAYRTGNEIRDQVSNAGLIDKFEAYAEEFFSDINPNERIFQGYTNNGRRYVAHTLENVVKILKKELRGGEGYNYGVGSIRSAVTPQFKSIKQIREAKDRLMDKAAFEAVKDEIDKEFFALSEQLAAYHSYAKEFGFGDTVSSMMYDAAKMGVPRALKENGFGEVPAEAQQDIVTFLGKLRDLPAEYFEAKILRDVDLTEFSGAVVPEGVSQKVIDALDSRGVKDIRYYKSGDEEDRRAKIGEFENLFFQQNNAAFNPETLTITALKGANLSSVLHESAHFFFENDIFLASELIGKDDLTVGEQQILGDVAKLLDWHGIKGTPESQLQQWFNMSFEERRTYHERTAESFEKYLFEGKAPSIELQSYFQKFREWMTSVYKTLKNFLANNPEAGKLNDEVRGVFDRMLATEEQIQLAEQGRSMMPLFTDQKKSGMTPELFAAYQEQAKAGTNEAIDALQSQGLRDMQWLHNFHGRMVKKLQKEAKAKRAEIEIEVRKEVMSQPVYRAWQFLTGKIDEEGNSGRFDLQAVEEMGYPVEMVNHLKTLKMTAKTGLNPDIVSDLFGFSSADELIRTLLAADSPRDAINKMTDARMLAENGELATPEAIERAADVAIYNEARGKFIASEANALNAALGNRKILIPAVKEYAEKVISGLKVRNIRPSQYTGSSVRAAKLAQKASEKGDIQTAAAEKVNQLIGHYAAKAAYEAQDDVQAAQRYIKRFDKRSKTLDSEYQDQIEALLERYDLKPISNKEVDRRQSLLAWVSAQKEMGLEPDISEDLLNEANRKSYKEMTVEEFRGLIDTIKQIEHLGRLKHKLLTAQDQREFKIIADEIAQEIVDNGGKSRKVNLEPPKGIVPWLEGLTASHRKLSSLVRQMEGGKDGGVFWSSLIRTMNEASVKESVMNEQATVRLAEIYKPLLKMRGGLNGAKVFIPEIRDSLTRGGRLSIALNWGNATNRDRIMQGEKWNERQVNAILKTLTREEAKFVNDVWEFLDSFWPQVAAKEKRVTGREPEKVNPEPFQMQVSDGSVVEMRGGYYPIKYDTTRDDRSEKNEAAEVAKDMMRGAFTRSTTRRGHTKERVEGVNRPVRKSLDVITQHVSQVTHDLAWHEWLIDANKIMDAKQITQAIREHYGHEVLRTMKDALVGIATADVVPQTKIDTALLYLRANVSRSTMGFSLTTALLQPFGLAQSMVRIGVKPVLRGMARWGGDAVRLESSMTWIKEKSTFMRLRSKTFNRELHEIKGRVSQGHSKARTIYDASLFMLMQKAQLISDVPTWIGAYEKAKAEGVDEETAIALADQSVLDSQGGGETKDLAEFQRKHPFLNMFYSYFNTTLNLAAESTAQTDFKRPASVAGWMSDMMLLMVIPALAPALLMMLLRGDDDWEDPEKLAKKMAQAEAGYLLGLMMGVREFSGPVSGFDYTGPPAGRVVVDIGKAGKQIGQGELDEACVTSLIRVAGDLFGIPTAQLLRSWRGWKAWDDGDSPATAILLGPPPKD